MASSPTATTKSDPIAIPTNTTTTSSSSPATLMHAYHMTHPTDPTVEWSTHSFCSYSICRATLPVRESIHSPHELSIHFAHSRTSSSSSTDSAPVRHGSAGDDPSALEPPQRKSSAVIATGRDEWMGVDDDDESPGEREIGVGLVPMLSEES